MMISRRDAKTNLFIAFSLGALLSFVVSQGLSKARADLFDCSDEISRFQGQVEKCILESKDLEDAKGCWEL
jgi:hypothetical protein